MSGPGEQYRGRKTLRVRGRASSSLRPETGFTHSGTRLDAQVALCSLDRQYHAAHPPGASEPANSDQNPLSCLADRGVHRVGGEVDVARPTHEAVGTLNLGEDRRILQRLEDAVKMRGLKLDDTLDAISKPDGQSQVFQRANLHDISAHLDLTHCRGSIFMGCWC